MAQPSAAPSGNSVRQFRIVLASTITILILPILLDLALSPLSLQQRLFSYAAPDTFYYLTVARNIGLWGRFSFDGEHLSNGYHPLWQILTALPYALHLPRANSPWVLAYLVGMTLAAQSLALSFLARVFRRTDGTLSWLFVFMPAGMYALCVSPIWLSLTAKQLADQNPSEGAQPVYGTLWSYINGMETSLVLLFFSIVLWLAMRARTLDRPIWFGLAVAGLAFARLDHALIGLPILAGISLGHIRQPGTRRQRLVPPITALLAFALPIVVYLVVNHVFVGSALPISGKLKSSFPFVTTESFNFLVRFINRIIKRERDYLDDQWRTLQLVIPVLFAILTPLVVARVRLRRGRMLITWAGPNPRLGGLLLLVAAGVLWLAAYDFFFVYFYGVGHWYVPVSTLFTSLVSFYAAERIRDAWKNWRARRIESPTPRPIRERFASYAIPVVAVVAAFFSFFPLHRSANYHLRYANFAIDEAPTVRNFFTGKGAKLIDCDDGIVAWASEFPSMSGTGLGLDTEAARAKINKPGLLPLAMQRGYTLISALVYLDSKALRSDDPKDVLAWVAKTGAFTQLGDVKNYDWSVAYWSKNHDFAIVRAASKPAARTAPTRP